MLEAQYQPFEIQQIRTVLAPLQLCFQGIALEASNIHQPSKWQSVVNLLLQVKHFKNMHTQL